jgi:hypothetical protein
VWWTRYCPSVSTKGTGNSALITAIYMEAADTVQGGSGIEFATPLAIEYQIYNSNGVRKLSKVDHQNRVVITNDSRMMPMRWFVRDYQVGVDVASALKGLVRRLLP